MPRNGSSVYSLPAGNPVIPGTIIATTWANTTLTDIATALTNSLSTDGSTASVSLAGKTMSGGTFSGPAVTGVLTLTGGQIQFPAVAIPSAGGNVLDDYEEGTFTPTLTYATPGNLVVAYSFRTGTYVKIGKQVTANILISTSTYTHTTASGNLQITGLPFSCVETAPVGGCRASGIKISPAAFPISVGLNPVSSVDVGTTVLLWLPGINDSSEVPLVAANHTSGSVCTLVITVTYPAT